MRATLLNHRYAPYHGGSERYIQKLAEWFVDSCWDAEVVTTDAYDLEYFWDDSHREVDAPAQEIVNGVVVHRVPVRHSVASSVRFQAGRRAMGEFSRFFRWRAPYSRFAAGLVNLPDLEMTLNSLPVADVIVAANLGLEGLALAGAHAAERLETAFVLLPFAHVGSAEDTVARRYISMPHQVDLVRRADMLVALTRAEAETLEGLGARPERIVVAGAGIDDCTLSPVESAAATPRRREPFTIISIGAMAVEKGTVALVQASRILMSMGLRHRLILVGPEMSAFGAWFERSGAIDCDWIENRGVVTEAEKEKLLTESHAFVMASRTESFGIVYLEAWAAGLPVVAANGDAVSEVVSDGEDGILVPFGDPTAIADVLFMLAQNPNEATRLGLAGFEKVRRHFLWPHVLQRIESGFARILGIEVATR